MLAVYDGDLLFNVPFHFSCVASIIEKFWWPRCVLQFS